MNRIDRAALRRPELVPLGDCGVLVRFGANLDDHANRAALNFATTLAIRPIPGLLEVVPSLVSVLLRYDPEAIDFWRLSGEIGLRLQSGVAPGSPGSHDIAVRFEGPDLADVAQTLGLSVAAFIARHNAAPLRVLTTGFAPGFIYCGFHPETLNLPRRGQVRASVPAGSVLFAAGQTAVTATEIPTGWHVIGQTDFRNFQPEQNPPTLLRSGDLVKFEAVG